MSPMSPKPARYSMVFVELQYLGAYLVETERHGFSLDEAASFELRSLRPSTAGDGDGEVFEIVQYEGNCLPRLYLLVTVGMVSDAHGMA